MQKKTPSEAKRAMHAKHTRLHTTTRTSGADLVWEVVVDFLLEFVHEPLCIACIIDEDNFL